MHGVHELIRHHATVAAWRPFMSGLDWGVGSRIGDNGEPVAAINLMGNTYPRNQCSLAQDETAPIRLTFSDKNLTVLCEVTLSATLSANGYRIRSGRTSP